MSFLFENKLNLNFKSFFSIRSRALYCPRLSRNREYISRHLLIYDVKIYTFHQRPEFFCDLPMHVKWSTYIDRVRPFFKIHKCVLNLKNWQYLFIFRIKYSHIFEHQYGVNTIINKSRSF